VSGVWTGAVREKRRDGFGGVQMVGPIEALVKSWFYTV